jgi:hypothetical protein
MTFCMLPVASTTIATSSPTSGGSRRSGRTTCRAIFPRRPRLRRCRTRPRRRRSRRTGCGGRRRADGLRRAREVDDGRRRLRDRLLRHRDRVRSRRLEKLLRACSAFGSLGGTGAGMSSSEKISRRFVCPRPAPPPEPIPNPGPTPSPKPPPSPTTSNQTSRARSPCAPADVASDASRRRGRGPVVGTDGAAGVIGRRTCRRAQSRTSNPTSASGRAARAPVHG